MSPPAIEKRQQLSDPVAAAANRTYLICSQNGLFPDPWAGHLPHEMWGLWSHPIKLLDGFWFALRPAGSAANSWLVEADVCRVHPTHTEFEYRLGTLHIVRRDFAPEDIEGLIVELLFSRSRRFPQALQLDAVLRSDLRPAWLGQQAGLHDAPDQVRFGPGPSLIFEDGDNPWVALVAASPQPERAFPLRPGDDGLAPLHQTAGQGATAALRFTLPFHDGDEARLRLFIAGSAAGPDAAAAALQQLETQHEALWAHKQALYQGIDSRARLQCPDPLLQDAFRWSKFNCRMLQREMPGLASGAGAGLPTYPWWFGIDTEYTVPALLHGGLFELAQQSLRLLHQASLQANPGQPGRVIHELTTTGVVYNKGNLVETPAFTRAVYQCWLWTGDQAFLQEMYPFCKQGILDYVLGQMDPDGDLCASGRSIIESHEMHAGFETVDVAAYTWQALHGLAHMAPAAGDEAAAPRYLEMAAKLGACIREEWWMEEEGLFADIRAPLSEVHEVIRRIQNHILPRDSHRVPAEFMAYLDALFGQALAQRASGPHDVDLPWLLRHWVTICPLEAGLATPEQARKAFARLESPEFSSEHGMVLHPLRRDVMSINTAILAGAQALYGRADQARDTLQAIARTLPLHMPGAISEALPDQWCFLQLWSALGPIATVVEGFFGLRPCAAEKRLRVAPHFPAAWDHAALHDLRVGPSAVTVDVQRTAQAYTLELTASETLHLEAGCIIPPHTHVQSVLLNGAPTPWQEQATPTGRCLLLQTQTPATLHITWEEC